MLWQCAFKNCAIKQSKPGFHYGRESDTISHFKRNIKSFPHIIKEEKNRLKMLRVSSQAKGSFKISPLKIMMM